MHCHISLLIPCINILYNSQVALLENVLGFEQVRERVMAFLKTNLPAYLGPNCNECQCGNDRVCSKHQFGPMCSLLRYKMTYVTTDPLLSCIGSLAKRSVLHLLS